MPKIDMQIGGTIVARFAFEVQNISAKGGPEFPILIIPYELTAFGHTDGNEPGIPFHPATCLYLSGEFSATASYGTVAQFHEDVALCAYSKNSPSTKSGNLEIPLDMLSVAHIEHARTSDLLATLKFRILRAIHVSESNRAVQKFDTAESNSGSFNIPKSHWIERILPELGYRRIELLEVRIPPANSPNFGLPSAVDEIRKARDFIIACECDKAVGHCRNAVETIVNSRPLQLPGAPSFSLKTDTFVHDHLSNRLGSDQSKLLADQLKALWTICSKAPHPSGVTFTRADAEFILRNTIAVVEYVGRLLA